MYDNEYFVVDMASCTSTGEIINSLSLALETLNHSGKKIVLKLNNNYLNQSQILSMQSLITSYGCILDTIETTNPETAAVAQNMNIYVQQPIEKRVEEKYDEDENLEFKTFSLDVQKNPNDITLKEVNGLHFEADLDAMSNNQNRIDIASDLREAGINPKSDFDTIEQQISNQYSRVEEIMDTVEKFSPSSLDINTQVISEIPSENESQIMPQSVITAENDDRVEQNKEEFENAEKNSIGVYKKAYDEDETNEEQWEEVDFYETSTNEPIISDTKETTYITQTLRSGQVLEFDGNVVIIGDCHPGSEIRAVGDITVWGVLSGIAHAGYKGNASARIRALKMNAVQLRISNCYSRRPDGTNIPYIIRSSIFTPEEARIVDNEIVLYKINQN